MNSINRMYKNNTSLSAVDKFIFLLPLLVIFLLIFNVPDTKHLVSRTVAFTCIYSLIRYSKVIAYEFKQKFRLSWPLIIVYGYFMLMHLINDGNSDLPRAFLIFLAYFWFVPFGAFSKRSLLFLTTFSGIAVGISAIYQVAILNINRAGFWAINPIPFAYYAGLCFLFISFFFGCDLKRKWLGVLFAVSGGMSFVAVILSQTRASILALVLVSAGYIAYSVFRTPSVKKIVFSLAILMLMPILLMQIPLVENRVNDAWQQIQQYSNNNYRSSTGMRIKLWQSGFDIASGGLLFGTEREKVVQQSVAKIKSGQYPKYLRSFLDSENANFHNQYIQVLVDGGLIGLALLLFVLTLPLRIVHRSDKHGLKVFVFMLVGYTMICMNFDSLFLYNHTLLLYLSVIGMVFTLTNTSRKES